MSVTSVYRYIIDDVIRNIRIEFVNEGLEDRIIAELQHMWESRLMQSGAVQEPTPTPPAATTAGTPVTNIATAGTSTSTTTNKDSPPSSSSPPPTTTNPPTTSNGSNTTTTTTSDVTPEHVRTTLNTLRQFNNIPGSSTNSNNGLPQTFGKPSQFMPPREGGLPHMELPAPGSSQSLRSIMNIPQNDGSTEEPQQPYSKEYIDNLVLQKINERNSNQDIECSFSINIPQLDGNDDELDDDSLLEEHRPDSNSNNSNIESLGSDLDDDEDNDPDPVIEHFVLCQYEKVTRVKNKRKCNFKDGVMHLNGRDSLFHKANAEFVWK